MSVDDFSKTLCYFPQFCIGDDDQLVGFKYVKKGHPKKYFFEHNGDQDELPDIKNVNNLTPRANLYAKSEYHLTQNKADSASPSSAFNKLIKMDAIESKLPKDEFKKAESEKANIHPVTLSFFADKSADALLSLIMVDNEKKSYDKTKILVEQALGSIHNEIYTRRQEFLENWCMTLGDRVDDICQKEIKDRSNEADKKKYEADDEKRQKEAKKKAMQFAFKAIREMAKILTAQEPDCFAEKSSPEFKYNPKKQPSNQISEYIQEYYVDTLDISPDRKEYVNQFCKKAEMYAEEFVASEGKLKGRLSAPTVRELKMIAYTSDPVNARILIKGEPGGGKGATAEDFHFYCMKRIAKNIKDIISKRNKDTKKRSKEIDAESDSVHKQEKEKDLKDEDLKHLIENSKYLKEVMNNLNAIYKLPSIFGENESVLKTKFFLRQISNTGWWLWNRVPKSGEDIEDHLKYNLYNSSIQLNSPVGDEKVIMHYYVGLLKDKILFEDSSKKPDWSFNFLQVNCGILGGENSELAEAIERLFGKSGSNKTTMPGLFQTCSYMGGTLFLDEIADAPVRVQDNLLRPLEEGKVSRTGWETFDEKVDNIRIVGATFKELSTLAKQYQETLLSEKIKGFRPDLLTRLTRNPPVYVTPICNYFVPTEPTDDDFPSQFAFVLNNSWLVSSEFWRKVYDMVSKQIDEHCPKARPDISDKHETRRKIASKITMRLFKEVGKIAQLKNSTKEQRNRALEYLGRMLDYLLVETN